MMIDRYSVFSVWALLCLVGVGTIFAILSAPGEVCNNSSLPIWITANTSNRMRTYQLFSGQCTKSPDQDAEIIWGKYCIEKQCRFQSWKIGSGAFHVTNGYMPSNLLNITGWGLLSGWSQSPPNLRPNPQFVNYTLNGP